MNIIGITGTLGAGKGTIVEYLVRNRGFAHYSVRTYLIEEIESRGMPVNRDSMVSVANELRAKNGSSYIIEELYKIAQQHQQNCVIESIRTPGEAESLSDKGNFCLIAVDADPEIRYQRISLRASETDHISYETFLENEKREFTSDDPNKQNLKKCIEMAAYVISNNAGLDNLYLQIEEILKKHLKIK
jgi:dephospho-CoA kinase